MLIALKLEGFTQRAVYLIRCLVFWTIQSSTFFADSQFCDLMLLLLVFWGGNNVDEEWMAVVGCVPVPIGGTEAIEAFHAYE